MRYLKVLLLLVLISLLAFFFIQNTAVLTQEIAFSMDFFVQKLASVPMPIYAIMVGCFALGTIMSMMYFMCDKIRTSAQNREYSSRIAELEEELNSLRNLPLEEDFAEKNEEPEA
ncbi:MAG: lipopolysaccharide assembly protein LapA domain-containing protein [Desulfovibrio sp.]